MTPVYLLQLPDLAASSGGPICNDAGELVGMLSHRQSVNGQMVQGIPYAECTAFLAEHRAKWQPRTPEEKRTALQLLQHQRRRPRSELPMIEDVEAYIAEHPRDARGYRLRGIRLAHEGQHDAALIDFVRVGELDPYDRQAMAWRAELLRKSNPKQSRGEWLGWLEYDPTDADAWMHLGDMQMKLGEADHAIHAWRQAIRCSRLEWGRLLLRCSISRPKEIASDQWRERMMGVAAKKE